jgi:FkbM family methyltransferase
MSRVNQASVEAAVAGALRRAPAVEEFLESLPWPVRFADGKRRRATTGVARMHRFWLNAPIAKPESEGVLAAYDGGDVIDIGAFHGWYSLLLGTKARPEDRFVSIEPDPAAYAPLLRTLAAAESALDGPRMWAMCAPAGDGSHVQVSWPDGVDRHPRISSGGTEGDRTVAVDDLVATAALKPAFVKIDVEGAEWFVIQGMRKTLTAHRPVLMLEIHRSWQPREGMAEEIEAILRDAGYELEILGDAGKDQERQLWRPAASA